MTCEQYRYLTHDYVHELIQEVGGLGGSLYLRGPQGRNLLESSLAQPKQTFAGEDLYPSLADKAAILYYCLVKNHPFVDGNKRFAVAALEAFLDLNSYVLLAPDDELLAVTEWLASCSEADALGKVRAWLDLRITRIP